MSDETELAFVARLRDEASRQARELRSTLDTLTGTTRAVTVPIEARNEAGKAIASVQEELKGVGPAAQAAARQASAASAEIGRSFVDSAGRIRNADGTFAKAGTAAGTATVSGFRKTSEHGAAESGRRFGSIFTKESLGPLRGYGEAALGFLAIDKVSEFVRQSVDDARAVQKAQRLTAQAIKTTGGAAGVTADDVQKLSERLAASTGIDEAQIQTGARLMLTFRQVRNEVGKGNDIYTRAVQLGDDVAVSMGESQQSAAIQLGKALNDPVRGLAMLNRVGIQFDATQTARIKKLVKEGNLLGAQKIILGEVTKEFGGSARAAATSGGRLSEAFRELRVELGTALFGALGKVENALAGRLIPALHALPGEIKAGIGYLERFGSMVEPGLLTVWHTITDDIVPSVHAILVAVRPLAGLSLVAVVLAFRAAAAATKELADASSAVIQFVAGNRALLAVLAGVLVGSLVPAIVAAVRAFAMMIALNVGAALLIVRTAIAEAAAAFVEADGAIAGFSAALASLDLNPIGLALAAVGAVVGGLIWAFHSSGQAAKDARKGVDDYVAGLHVNYNSARQVRVAEADLTKQIADRTAALKSMSVAQAAASGYRIGGRELQGGGTDVLAKRLAEVRAQAVATDPRLVELRKQLGIMQTDARHAATNTGVLSSALGVSRSAVVQAANAVGVDLKDAYAGVAPKVTAYIQAAQLSRKPTQQGAADIKALANQANTASDEVNLLSDALARFAGDDISADQAAIAFRDNIAALDKALHKSHGSLKLNSQAGRDARDALDNAAQGAIAGATAQAKLKGGVEKARASLVEEIRILKAHAGNSAVARHAIGDLQNALAHLPQTAAAAADGVSSSGKRIAAAADRAARAARDALARHKDDAKTVGAEWTTGYAAGILSHIGAADAAAIRVANAATAGARSHKGQHSGSPARKAKKVGNEWGDGYVIGIRSRAPQVTAAGIKLVNAVTSSFSSERSTLKSTVQGVVSAIMAGFTSSPRDLDKALKAQRAAIRKNVDTIRRTLASENKALTGRASTLRGEIARTKNAASRRRYVKELATIETQRKAVEATRRALDKDESAAIDSIRRRTDRLDALATRRANVAARLAAAQAKLAGLKQSKSELQDSITSGISGFADIMGTGPGNDAPVTIGFITQGLTARLAAVRKWSHDIRTLIRRHVDKGIIQQIIAAGPEAGEAYAAAIASATDAQIAGLNTTESSISKTGASLADYAGSSFYDAGIKAAKGLVDGLRKREKDLDRAARELGRKIAKAIKAELGIHSPSRVLRDQVGSMVPAGVAEGIAAHSYLAEAAAAKMAANVAKASAVDLTPATAALARVPAVTITRSASSTVEIRHRVSFDQPEVASKMSATDVADIIARDPRSAERLERALAPTRGRIKVGVHTASR